jgi:hypothetical protein
MALTHFAFVNVGVGYGSSNIPVAHMQDCVSEGVVPSGDNQQTTAVAPTGILNVMCRVATDTAVYVKFGANPNALTGTTARFFIPANGVEYFMVAPGDKAAVVNA